MKYIELTKGKQAIVDDKDFELLSSFNWYFSGRYARRTKRINGKHSKIFMHKVVSGLTRSDKNTKIDHINGNSLDNRRSNLRVCTHKENIRNSNLSKNNKTGFKGVSFVKDRNRYQAKIKVDYKDMWLGFFENKIDAAKAYNQAAKIYFGSFARLNNV